MAVASVASLLVGLGAPVEGAEEDLLGSIVVVLGLHFVLLFLGGKIERISHSAVIVAFNFEKH